MEVVILERKTRLIVSLLAISIFVFATAVNGASTANPNLVPTFHKGFSAGLRPAPTQCVTEVLVDYTKKDYARTAREACEKVNQRKNFCVDFCMNKVERDKKAAREVTLKNVPKAACLKPVSKTYSSVEECMKARTKHCAVNCEDGRERAKCSRTTMVECRKIGKGVYKIV